MEKGYRSRTSASGPQAEGADCPSLKFRHVDPPAGKSLRWVAGQLGHSNPELTLRQYAHMLPQEETDLSFADFDGPRRPYTAPALADELPNENAPGGTHRGRYQNLERETGLEPGTLSLGRESEPEEDQ